MMYVSGRSEPAFIRTSSLSFLFQTKRKTAGVPHPGGFVLLPIKCFPYDYEKSPRQSFSAYRRENKLQSVFPGTCAPEKTLLSPPVWNRVAL